MELKDKKIAFLGDSITEGCGASEPKYMFVEKVRELSGATVLNYGIGGTRIARRKKPSPSNAAIFDKYYASRVDEMEDADIVFIFGGTNDWGHGDAILGTINDNTVDSFYGAYNVLLDKINKKYPNSTVVIATPIHRSNENNKTNDWGGPLYFTFLEVVNAVKEIGAYHNLPVCDFFANEELNPTNEELNKKFFADGLHPNDAGHLKIAQEVIEFFNKL